MITGFGTDLVGELKLLCWEVGAGTPWYYLEKYTKFPLVFLFKPLVAMTAFKLGQTQRSLYDLEDELLRSKTSLEVEHYIEFGQFSNNWQSQSNVHFQAIAKPSDAAILPYMKKYVISLLWLAFARPSLGLGAPLEQLTHSCEVM